MYRLIVTPTLLLLKLFYSASVRGRQRYIRGAELLKCSQLIFIIGVDDAIKNYKHNISYFELNLKSYYVSFMTYQNPNSQTKGEEICIHNYPTKVCEIKYTI